MPEYSIRRPSVGRPIFIEKLREGVTYVVFLVAVVSTAVVAVQNYDLRTKLELKESGLYRSQDELVNGGKRFMDYYYSLNSSTIKNDQYRALKMMATEPMQRSRLEYLIQHDIVRRAEHSKLRSELDWPNASVSYVGEGSLPNTHKFNYEVPLIMRGEKTITNKFDMVLTLGAVQKSDENTEGVAVFEFDDIAYNPFAKGNE